MLMLLQNLAVTRRRLRMDRHHKTQEKKEIIRPTATDDVRRSSIRASDSTPESHMFYLDNDKKDGSRRNICCSGNVDARLSLCRSANAETRLGRLCGHTQRGGRGQIL